MKQLYYYGVGSLHNLESSVDGGKYIRLPLMIELIRKGFDIKWIGFGKSDRFENKYIELLNLKENDYTIDLTKNVQDISSLFMNEEKNSINQKCEEIISKSPGDLFIELRPNIDKPGYNFVNEWNIQLQLIDLFHSKNQLVFVWDQDVWASQLPEEYRKKVILLRSYFEELDGFDKQELFLYGWFKPSFSKSLKRLSKNKIFDATYCGNVYGRRDEFLEYFKPFEQQKKLVCVQGNWLRKKYDDRDFALDNFEHFLFFGRTEHWTTLPSIAMSKSVIQFSNKEQQSVGLPTVRIFETLMGESVIFCSDKIKHIEKIVPEELIVSSGDDLINKWNNIDKNNSWQNIRKLFENKLKTNEHSYRHRAKQLIGYMKKYS